MKARAQKAKKQNGGPEHLNGGYLTGQLLIAMPGMRDPRFAGTVIYLCAHSPDGAMGLVINRTLDEVSFPDLLQQLKIEPPGKVDPIRVHFGGPVESGRGFVLHSSDYGHESTLKVDQDIGLTATLDILRDIAQGRGPKRKLFALGYAGWGPGQLDGEIHANGWLTVAADDELIFAEDLDQVWDKAVAKIGVDPRFLTNEAGRA